MAHWLADRRTVQAEGWMTRFDAAHWVVNFPRPMMAAATTTAADAVRVDAVFYNADDLAGLIWESEDRHDHPLLRYETDRDFRGCVLSFRWRSGGVKPLDAVNGPTLTIEGRDAQGNPRAWYVRLWNYATGTPDDAGVRLDFGRLDGGFLLPGEADPVWAGDVDRMFVSLVAPGHSGRAEPLAAAAEGWAEMSAIACEGPGAVIAVGEAVVPPHGMRIAGGYDDSYHLTPARVLGQVLALGYRGAINHYVGMSHYFRLEGGVVAGGAGAGAGADPLNVAARAWHRDFAKRAHALGFGVIWSLSYELFDAHCPEAWKQRAADGAPGLTGWAPPSALLSPANADAMAYLRAVARAFVGIGAGAGLEPRFQVGEPWWWTMPDGRPCLYDAAAVAAIAPVPIATMRGPMTPAQLETLDRAGALLARTTRDLADAAVGAAGAGGCERLLLAYLPTVLDAAAPEAKRMNLPVGWAWPAFDVLQLEDYDWVTAGDTAASAEGAAAATARLGYPAGRQHYLSGFVLRADERWQWERIEAAAQVARGRGVADVFLWALPQVLRDGLVRWDTEGDEMQAFDDVVFPLALGREAEVAPSFSTAVVTGQGGAEQRNADWGQARTRYDAGPGVRSEADVAVLLDFFRARMGRARAFRFRDPFDWRAADQRIGTGDGHTRRFALAKHYGETARRITRPVAGSVRIAVGGVPAAAVLEPGGWAVLAQAPAAGAAVTASFDFDVAVRFAEDSLTVSRATWGAGEAASVPLIEVREA